MKNYYLLCLLFIAESISVEVVEK